ncbi:hypothetical protein BCV70DRAFT_94375 [Testicularia cyperi]|uniref:BZIP domain-containing protein n=1 Tax=Testicularia cyperi TaxID=1882483 RepID=A0A317XR53_9BASI|nr:hypothetical protein BCV70DRAFT_94375 [Testicularia cyperi]
MAATQVARNNSFTGFDEFVNMPGSPTLAPCARAVTAAPAPASAPPAATAAASPSSSTSTASSSSNSAVAAFNMRKVGLDQNQPPPSPGSSPEAIFRYYLAVELRKAGTQPDEALLDRYVRNHFDSLFKNKNAPQQSTAPTASSTKPESQPSSALAPAKASNMPASGATTSQFTVAAVPRPSAMPPRATPSAPQAKAQVNDGHRHAHVSSAASAVNVQVAASERDAGSPPELDVTESPAFSGHTGSPVATPPALESIREAEPLDFGLFGDDAAAGLLCHPTCIAGPSTKYEETGGIDPATLTFFRTSPFRLAEPADSAATIDPHVVESGSGLMGAESYIHADLAASSAPAVTASALGHPLTEAVDDDEAIPMSEDGLSDEDGEDSKAALRRQIRFETTPDGEHGSPSRGAQGSNKPLSDIPMAVGTTNNLKPDPEEYKKLSSKEKRQLRNKISARNFRTRRKEYITHLEEQIADRDNIIEGLRQQLSQMTTENKSLREEVRITKSRTLSSQDVSKILEALQNMGPLNTTLVAPPAGAAAPASGRSSPTSMLNTLPGGGSISQDYGAAPATPSAFFNFASGDGSSRPSTPTMAVPSSPRSMSPRPSILRRASPSILPQANPKKDVAPQSSFWGGVGAANGSGSFMSVC